MEEIRSASKFERGGVDQSHFTEFDAANLSGKVLPSTL